MSLLRVSLLGLLAALLLGAAPASAAVLYDQTSGAPGAAVPSMVPDPAPGEFATGACDGRVEGPDCYAIDDFTIPPGQVWLVKSVSVEGQGGLGDDMNWIATESAGLPEPDSGGFGPFKGAGGTQGTGGHLEVSSSDDFDIPDSSPEGVALGAGHFWLSVFSVKAPRSHQPFTPWSWDTEAKQSGMPGAWSSTVCAPDAAYKPLAACGQPGPDLRFKIEGEQIDSSYSNFKLGKRERTPDGGMNIFMTVPGLAAEPIGLKKVGGKGQVTFLKTLGRLNKDGTASVLVRVRPKGATARKLKEGVSFKVRVAITYRRAVLSSQELKIPAATKVVTVHLKKKGR